MKSRNQLIGKYLIALQIFGAGVAFAADQTAPTFTSCTIESAIKQVCTQYLPYPYNSQCSQTVSVNNGFILYGTNYQKSSDGSVTAANVFLTNGGDSLELVQNALKGLINQNVCPPGSDGSSTETVTIN